jgi:RHH-type rel operon transcriptional repressor/antitoxin RelB
MSQTLSVRLPDNLAAELNNIAEITERSKSYLVQKALEIYLQEQADLQVAIDRLRDVSDPLVSMAEMRRGIGP